MTRIDLTALKMKLRPLIPEDWVRRVRGGALGLGYDQATTEKELSNPASVTVMERNGRLFSQRLVVRYKAEEYKVRLAVLELLLDDLRTAEKRARRLVIDATSEKAAAQQARDQFAGTVPVEYYVASANIEEGGLKYPAKTLLCERYQQSFEDNAMALPKGEWIVSDHSLVKFSAGRFEVEEDAAGNHGDCWTSGMLALWGLMSKGERAELTAVDIRGGAPGGPRPGLLPCFQTPQGGTGRLLT